MIGGHLCSCLLVFSSLLVTLHLVASSKHNHCASPPKWTAHDESMNETTREDNSTLTLPWKTIAGNVTLVVLTNQQVQPAQSEQQTHNLELIYRSLINANFSNVRFILINSKNASNSRWLNETRSQVSFEVYQELDSLPVQSRLGGRDGDMFIYDRCGLLTYYIPFPLSFIHTQQPILQAALLATYFDSPCKSACQNTFYLNHYSSANVTLLHQNAPTLLTTNDKVEKDTSSQNATSSEKNIPGLSNLNMGQILMKFFEIFSKTHEELNKSTNKTANHTRNSVSTGLVNNSLESTTIQPSLSTSSFVLTKLRNMASMPDTCNQTSCLEWSTEKLLKARLCCLNHLNADEDVTETTNGTASMSEPVNNVGGFGCQLYARWRCHQILPIIKCCLRKVLNDYFDYTIKIREQQQRAQLGTTLIGRSASEPHKLSTI